DGWAINRTAGGYTLTAQLHSSSRDYFPSRGDKLPITGVNAVPRQFVAYRISDVQTAALSAAGPYLAQVTASGGLAAKHSGAAFDTLSQTDLRAGYMDYHLQPEWSALKAGSGEWRKRTLDGWHTGKWVSALDDIQGNWANWGAAVLDQRSIKGSPFTKFVQPGLADSTLRFLSVTVTHHAKETTDGLEKWGGFSGVVPVNSFPKWIAIPGGDNRWRLYDEEIERVIETDGSTVLFKVTRVLLGIPNQAKDAYGARLQWNQDEIGQRDWDDL
ncbi:MAG: hypothetical protein M0P55_15460, partial [Clostridiales bacterium]|nr:hypothetical protein [Clostridiales bacterium]